MRFFELTLSRTLPATPEEVYDAWLDASRPGGLWHGAERATVNAVVDGLYYHVVAHEGKLWPHYGRFLRLRRGQVIEITWMSEATRGLESMVTITLEPGDGGTLTTLRHANLPDDELGRSHEEGWSWYFTTLEQRFSLLAAGE